MTKTQRDNHKTWRLTRAAKRRHQRHCDSINDGFKRMATAFNELPRIVAGVNIQMSILDGSYHGFRQPSVPPARPQFNVQRVNA